MPEDNADSRVRGIAVVHGKKDGSERIAALCVDDATVPVAPLSAEEKQAILAVQDPQTQSFMASVYRGEKARKACENHAPKPEAFPSVLTFAANLFKAEDGTVEGLATATCRDGGIAEPLGVMTNIPFSMIALLVSC